VPARETEGGRHPALVREAGWDPPVTYVTRERETAAACGVEYEWTFRDDDPNWVGVGACIADLLLEVKRGWGPLPDSGGHAHHDAGVWGGGCPTCLNNHNRPGDSTWYRVKTKFPSPGRICAAILAVAEDGRIAGSGDH
jgi:hypothetical protein